MSAFQIGERFKQDVRNARVIGEFTVKIGVQKLPGLVWQAISRLRPAAYPQEQSRVRPPVATSPVESEAVSVLSEPIVGYDLLASSQISELLATLDRTSIENIIQYESQTRKRQSIISEAQSL
ncbi:MAG: hypothetical protein RL623_867, partial [Actinomycetota bacterium]